VGIVNDKRYGHIKQNKAQGTSKGKGYRLGFLSGGGEQPSACLLKLTPGTYVFFNTSGVSKGGGIREEMF